jgi:glycosyltransferase involved in cell wall biosynthesis
MPIISVIVPAYNAEQTILETITSVQQQTFSDFELIVINDGSTDRTLELLSTVKDHRLKIFSYPNGGVPVARNRGIFQATGDFIAFLDADDLWTPDKLELQLAALQQHPDAGVVYSWAYYMDEKGESFNADNPIFFAGNVYAQLLVNDFIVSGSNCLIRKQAIESVGEFDPALSCAEDWDYWLRLAAHWPFCVVPKPQIFYRISSNSASSKVEVMEKCNLIVIDRGFQSAPPELQFLKNQSLANTYRYSAHLYLMRVSSADAAKQAVKNLWMAILLYPPILREIWTRNLLIKALLIQLVSPKVSRPLIQFISKLRTIRQSRLQQSRT